MFCLITPENLLPGELSSSASLRGMDLELQTQVTLDSSPDACTGDLHQPGGAAGITHTSRLHVLSMSTSLLLDLPLGLLHPQHPSLSLCWTRPDRLRLSRPALTPNVPFPAIQHSSCQRHDGAAELPVCSEGSFGGAACGRRSRREPFTLSVSRAEDRWTTGRHI